MSEWSMIQWLPNYEATIVKDSKFVIVKIGKQFHNMQEVYPVRIINVQTGHKVDFHEESLQKAIDRYHRIIGVFS